MRILLKIFICSGHVGQVLFAQQLRLTLLGLMNRQPNLLGMAGVLGNNVFKMPVNRRLLQSVGCAARV
jgi:hypothetical protein